MNYTPLQISSNNRNGPYTSASKNNNPNSLSKANQVVFMNNGIFQMKTIEKYISDNVLNKNSNNSKTSKLFVVNLSLVLNNTKNNQGLPRSNNVKSLHRLLNKSNVNIKRIYITQEVYNMLTIKNKVNEVENGTISIYRLNNKKPTVPVIPNFNKDLYNSLVVLMNKQSKNNFNKKMNAIKANNVQGPRVTNKTVQNLVKRFNKQKSNKLKLN